MSNTNIPISIVNSFQQTDLWHKQQPQWATCMPVSNTSQVQHKLTTPKLLGNSTKLPNNHQHRVETCQPPTILQQKHSTTPTGNKLQTSEKPVIPCSMKGILQKGSTITPKINKRASTTAQYQKTTQTQVKTTSTNNKSILHKHAAFNKALPHLKFIQNKNTPTAKQQTQFKIDQQQLAKAIPPSIPVQEDIGKYGLMWPRGLAKSHPAAAMLDEFSTLGCPVDTGNNWTEEQIAAAIKRGPHISAKDPEAAQYLHAETMEKIKGGYLTKTTWGEIKHNHPPNLKISPVALIPHKSRSYRCILDLSFQLKINNKKISSVNLGTLLRAPQKSMAHLGMVIRRLIYILADNYNVHQPFVFSKCDIKDGFWRMIVNRLDAWNFAYVLPPTKKVQHLDDTEIVIPHALQMGWAESPPFFCAATETGRDVINQLYTTYNNIPQHYLEHNLLTEMQGQQQPSNISNTATAIEVYVDDFISCTNNTTQAHLKHLARAMLHGIHSVFPPPSVTGHSGEDPIAMKKLLELEGMFQHKKEVLGWEFDGKYFTISLPKKKEDKILAMISNILKHRYATHKELEKLQGKLVHASLGIPGGKGLLSPLYSAVAKSTSTIKMAGSLKQCIKDWRILIKEIARRPTSVLELVPREPNYIGYVDSSKTAVGGVWVNGNKKLDNYIVWRLQWPQEIQEKFSSKEAGTISINDLEMAGTLLAWLVLENILPSPLELAHVGIFCDNTSTVQWHNKKSTTTSTIAGHLLRALAL